MAKRELNDHIFMIIGDHAFTIEDLGPIADMRIDKAMQAIIDQGLLGEAYVGMQWFDVIKSSALKLEAAPEKEQILQHSLYSKYEAALERNKELSRKGELTQAHKDEMMQLRKDWQTAEKLAKL